MMWGGGSKEHPGKKRDKRPFSSENNNYRLSRERWSVCDQTTRKSLLDMASQRHNPTKIPQSAIKNEAIEQTKLNKDYVERTNAVIKYQDG